MWWRYALVVLGLALAAAACGGGETPAGDDDDPGAPDSGGGPGQPDAAPGPTIDAAPGTPDATPGPTVDAGPEPTAEPGCPGSNATFLPRPADTSLRGPWAVGARTVQVGRLTMEVWYPAAWGSEVGQAKTRYDIRKALPASQQATIPDADNPWQHCDCYRDVPIDAERGPYPVVVFVHGTAAFRTQSLEEMVHWASRGFVVVAADHPGLWLADILGNGFVCPDQPTGSQSLAVDVDAEIAAITQATGPLAFLAGRLDLTRLAVAGHSAGGNTVTGLAGRPGVRVVIPLAASSATTDSATLASVLYMAGAEDGVVSYASSKTGYNGSPSPRRFVGIENSGHLVFSDLCEIKNTSDKNLLQIAEQYGVCGANLAGFLFDCDPSFLSGPVGWSIVKYATSAVLEGVLQCTSGQDGFATITTKFPDVSESLSAP